MMLAQKLLSSLSGAVSDPLYVDDVFSAYIYTGNGSTQTINNGIDLAGKGGMVWCKQRDGTNWHGVATTQLGTAQQLFPNATNALTSAPNGVTAFASSGFSIGGEATYNYNTGTYISWTFRKAPKFFDVVTYTGNSAIRTIAHSLGQEVGTILVKKTNSVEDWYVYHRSMATSDYLLLNTTAARGTSTTIWNNTAPTTSVFSLGNTAAANQSGNTYVAYLFAHDSSNDGIVQCGIYVGNGSGTAGPVINLGWEPQYVLTKAASSTGDWQVSDSARGMPVGSADAYLKVNTSAAEAVSSSDGISVSATGFSMNSTSAITNGNGIAYIYVAIRRPNKPPTVGTQVYNAIARTGTGGDTTVSGVGFAPDFTISKARSAFDAGVADRLCGNGIYFLSSSTAAEANAYSAGCFFNQDGVSIGNNTYWNYSAAHTYINYFFKRAPGVFDIVCYKGTGDSQTISHNLTIKPEFLIIKGRTNTSGWFCTHKDAPNGGGGLLNTNLAFSEMVNSTQLKDGYCYLASGGNDGSTFSVTTGTTGVINVNASAANYVAYLFATKAGISRVGSYTGNGGTQTINCGFTTGARFIMIKRTDSTGDWFVYDSTRTYPAGNDPHISLNTTAAEVTTTDDVDYEATGFIVNQNTTTNLNVTSATYIFLSYA